MPDKYRSQKQMLANHKGEIPFVVLILPFLVGIGLGLTFTTVSTGLLFCIFAALSGVFIVLNLYYRRFSLYRQPWIGGSFLHIILMFAGWAIVAQNNELNSAVHFSKIQGRYLIAEINNEPTVKNGLTRFTATVRGVVDNNRLQNSTGSLLIALKDTAAKTLYYGDQLIIPAKYAPVDPPFNPGEFNYKKYLANQNIHYQAFLYSKQYVITAHNKGNSIIDYSLRLRRRLVEKFKRNMHDTSAIAVASTLILGYKADMSNDILQAYSKTGTIHVLSVSGAHVAIVYLVLNLLLGFLAGYKNGKTLKAVLIISLIWYYSLLTGFSPAVCRAAVMISMVIIGKTYTRYINSLNILAVSAFALLLYNPLFITDVGFQLSYLAVAGLIVFQPIVYKWIKFKNKWADKLWGLCSVSIAAQVITFPLSAFYFHQFPVYFLVSNLFIIIPSAIIMYVGILYLLLPQVPFVSNGLAFILEHSILLMNKGLTRIEHTPFASVGKIWLTTTEYLLAYLLIVSVFYYLFDLQKWALRMSLAVTLILSLSVSFKRVSAFNNNYVTILNLKKHQGLIFKNRNSAIVLSDVKPTDKTFQYSIQPYLDSNKIADVTVIGPSDSLSTSSFAKKGGLIQFKNSRLMVLNKQTANKLLPAKIKVDYLWVTGNPKTSISLLDKNFDYHTLIIDANNSDRLIRGLAAAAQGKHINYYVLKRNKSMLIASN